MFRFIIEYGSLRDFYRPTNSTTIEFDDNLSFTPPLITMYYFIVV